MNRQDRLLLVAAAMSVFLAVLMLIALLSRVTVAAMTMMHAMTAVR